MKILVGAFFVVMIASMAAIGFGNFGGSNSNRTLPIVIDSTPEPTSSAQQAVEGSSFDDALASGEDCEVLFQIRNAGDPQADDLDDINDDLRRIGCFSSSSSRTDLSDAVGFDADADYSPQQYQAGYDGCGYRPNQVFDEAGTRDPQAAAVWYSAIFFGSTARGAYAGCLDALEDKPSRFP